MPRLTKIPVLITSLITTIHLITCMCIVHVMFVQCICKYTVRQSKGLVMLWKHSRASSLAKRMAVNSKILTRKVTDSRKNNPCGSQALHAAFRAILCQAGLEWCKSHCPRYVHRRNFQQSSFWKEADYSQLVYAIVVTITRPLLHILGVGMAPLTK